MLFKMISVVLRPQDFYIWSHIAANMSLVQEIMWAYLIIITCHKEATAKHPVPFHETY